MTTTPETSDRIQTDALHVEQRDEEPGDEREINTCMSTVNVALRIIKENKQLFALCLSPIVSIFTTVSFMSVYYAEGTCQDALDFMEEYDSQELISHAMCCIPEWYIGIVGFIVSGMLGLYAVPFVWRSGDILGKCCCYSSENGTRIKRNSSPWVAILISVMSSSLIVVSIISLCVQVYIHGFAAFLLFMSGLILMFLQICGCGQVSCCKMFTLRPESWSGNKHTDNIHLWSKGFTLASLVSTVLSFLVSTFSTGDSNVAGESLFAMIGVFAQYSIICDLVNKEIMDKYASGDDHLHH